MRRCATSWKAAPEMDGAPQLTELHKAPPSPPGTFANPIRTCDEQGTAEYG